MYVLMPASNPRPEPLPKISAHSIQPLRKSYRTSTAPCSTRRSDRTNFITSGSFNAILDRVSIRMIFLTDKCWVKPIERVTELSLTSIDIPDDLKKIGDFTKLKRRPAGTLK
jgi:hypothetical protein